jgi:hypothetical protein
LPPQNTCRRRLKPTAATVTVPPPPQIRCRHCRPQKCAIFLRLRLYGYNDRDNLDHGYIMIGYLDIDIKNTVYSNSRTPVKSVRVVTCVHATPAVTAGEC